MSHDINDLVNFEQQPDGSIKIEPHRAPYLPSQEAHDLRVTEALARDERDRRIWAEERVRQLEAAAREVLEEWEPLERVLEREGEGIDRIDMDAATTRLAAVLAAGQTR